MDRFARVVLGYHGCDPNFAEALIRGEAAIDEWRPSANDYDWLGHGIYFWEFAPERAKEWSAKKGVIGAVIQLGNCLDFSDVESADLLADHFQVVSQVREDKNEPLPQNRGKRRDLDCLVINDLVSSLNRSGDYRIQTLRCPFLEGSPIFPGSSILRESHVQIAVLDKSCILGVFRPNPRFDDRR